MEQSDFNWLQQWYQMHCEGIFDKKKQIHLETLDNPGWSLTINLRHTELEKAEFAKLVLDRSDVDWIFSAVKDGNFEGRCGAYNLPEILRIFRIWANYPLNPIGSNLFENIAIENCDFSWIQKWYQTHCDGDWEHTYGILLETTNNPGWSFTVGLGDTELEGKKFQDIKLERSKDDWIFCTIKNDRFAGTCGIENLPEILKIFRGWAEDYQV